MNAYEILGLEEPKKIGEEVNSQNQQTNISIRENMTKKLRQLIDALNKILEDEKLTISERIKKTKDIIPDFLKYFAAYEKINTSANRTQYSNSQQCDIEAEAQEMLKNIQKRLTINVESPKNKKTINQNPYNLLGIRSDPNTLTDNTVDGRTYNLLRLTVSKTAPHDSEKCGEMLFQVTKFLWAHSLIETKEKRDAYPYKVRAQKALAANKGIIENLNSVSNIVPHATDELETGDGQCMQIINDGRLEYGPFYLKDENEINHYIIRKLDSGSEVYQTSVYGDININRMGRDPEYARQVLDILLSDESVELSNKYFGGYVGQIGADGKPKLHDELIAACILRQRQVGEQEKNNSNTSKKTNPAENLTDNKNQNAGENHDTCEEPNNGDDR